MDKSAVGSGLLEERVAMYLEAIEVATATNDVQGRTRLEKDIQTLMDLMERVSVGQAVTADMVPPPLQPKPQPTPGEGMANPQDVLSARLADYHKALYYADIETGDNRSHMIQTLQRGLQAIQELQEKAQAGYPVRPEDIPPPVDIPTDDEFVMDPKSVITERIALYYQAIEVAQDERQQTRVKTLQSGIQKMESLLKRAEANIPIYKKDLPSPPALGGKFRKQTEEYKATVSLLQKMSGLSVRAAKLAGARGDSHLETTLTQNAKVLCQALEDFEEGKPLDMSACPYSLADIQRLADEAGVPGSQHLQDGETVRLRLSQYKTEALKAKRAGDRDLAVKHMRMVKVLQGLVESLEKGEKIDVSKVPPPPSLQAMDTDQTGLTLVQQSQQGSLAQELSAFLGEPLLDNSSSSSSGSLSSLQTDSSASSPEKLGPTPSLMAPGSGMKDPTRGHKPLHRLVQQDVAATSGLNPLYALMQPNTGDTGSVVRQSAPPTVPNRALKPGSGPAPPLQPLPLGTGVNPHQPLPLGSQPLPLVNGSSTRFQFPSEQGTGNTVESHRQGSETIIKVNGFHNLSTEITCIEILKYERMQLENEGSDDAKLAGERLRQQMEEEKQRLRVGGYQAWLAYMGQVEEDVTCINLQMKAAREQTQEEVLASLIVKKELAERELAVMRKRLPELQT